MRITEIEILRCQAGWRPWTFLKLTTDEGLTGVSECTETFGSQPALDAAIEDLGDRFVVGEDPRSHQRLTQTMLRGTRQSAGGVLDKAIGAIENACLDLTGKALGVPVHQLLGGALRDRIPAYWSHCGTTRVRNASHLGRPPIRTLGEVADLGREVALAGFGALKTNVILLDTGKPALPGAPRIAEPSRVLMQGWSGPIGDVDRNVTPEILDAMDGLLGTFRDAVGPGVEIMLDLNFHFRQDALVRIARALAPHDLRWLEIDAESPEVLKRVQDAAPMPIAAGETLLGPRAYRSYLEAGVMDVAVIDVLWNGAARAARIAGLCETFDVNVAPHTHTSPLGTLIAAHLCAAIPNPALLEVDVDDVPWRDQLFTHPPRIEAGHVVVPDRPGWGTDLVDAEILAHATAA